MLAVDKKMAYCYNEFQWKILQIGHIAQNLPCFSRNIFSTKHDDISSSIAKLGDNLVEVSDCKRQYMSAYTQMFLYVRIHCNEL